MVAISSIAGSLEISDRKTITSYHGCFSRLETKYCAIHNRCSCKVVICTSVLSSIELFFDRGVECQPLAIRSRHWYFMGIQDFHKMRALLVMQQRFLQLHVPFFNNHFHHPRITNVGILLKISTDGFSRIGEGHVNIVNSQDTRKFSVPAEAMRVVSVWGWNLAARNLSNTCCSKAGNATAAPL